MHYIHFYRGLSDNVLLPLSYSSQREGSEIQGNESCVMLGPSLGGSSARVSQCRREIMFCLIIDYLVWLTTPK